VPDQAAKERLSAALSGRYEIDREIGQGGMAVVYLARDIKHDRKVALKVLRPELSSAMGIDRFPREIHIIAQMHHPHILPLHDSGEVDGFLYYVMPFVEGETLRTKLARGPLSINEGVRLLQEITDALAYAHQRGVIHRDIKPDNVMIEGKHATVTDFGIAKAVHSAARDKLTTVGIAVGTPQYMSPEQAMAEANVDHRADIYSVGVLGYEMLTGHPVFEGNTAQAILSAHVLEVPKDIRERRPDVPALLAEALLKCLAKDPANRWQSAGDLLAQLELVATTPSGGLTPTNTRPYKAVSGGATPVAGTGGRKTMRIAIAAAAVLVLGLAGVFIARAGSGSGKIEKIGVMPIEDISGKDAIFVNAMHDGLTNALAKLQLAGVASHTEMMRYKGGSKTTRDIAKENSLNAVIEATVFRAGDIMRINVQFTDPVTSKSLWSETFSPNVSDVLAAQSSVVEKIAAGVKGALAAPK
jgi:TolB-like protein/tRNA A-37 threonylcarbamoyl transferase component Bud32